MPANQESPKLMIELYDFQGFLAHNSSDLIRNSTSLNQNKQLHSDVFIFEASEEKTEYVLVLIPEEEQPAKY